MDCSDDIPDTPLELRPAFIYQVNLSCFVYCRATDCIFRSIVHRGHRSPRIKYASEQDWMLRQQRSRMIGILNMLEDSVSIMRTQ